MGQTAMTAELPRILMHVEAMLQIVAMMVAIIIMRCQGLRRAGQLEQEQLRCSFLDALQDVCLTIR
jgi:hypothetical protein